MKSGLDEFKSVLKDFNNVGSLAVKGSVAIPLVQAWSKLGPPPVNLVSAGASICQFATLAYSFHFWHELTPTQLNKKLRASLLLFVTAAVLGLFLTARFTAPHPGHEKLIIGFQPRPDSVRILERLSSAEALRGDEYLPTRIWTDDSVAIMEVVLPVVWISAFGGLSAFLSAFVLAHRSTGGRKGGRARKERSNSEDHK